MKRIFTLLLICTALLSFSACKKDPSVAKIFVRSQNNQLMTGTQVVIIADRAANESDLEYVDTLMTNSSGYVEFMLDEYFQQTGESVKVGTFDIICKKLDFQGTGRIRCRMNNTAVETVYIFE